MESRLHWHLTVHRQRDCGRATGLIYKDGNVAVPNVTFSFTSSSTDWERETRGGGELRQRRRKTEVALEAKCLGVNNWEENRFPTATSIKLFCSAEGPHYISSCTMSVTQWQFFSVCVCVYVFFFGGGWFFINAIALYPFKFQHWLWWQLLNLNFIIQFHNSSCIKAITSSMNTHTCV